MAVSSIRKGFAKRVCVTSVNHHIDWCSVLPEILFDYDIPSEFTLDYIQEVITNARLCSCFRITYTHTVFVGGLGTLRLCWDEGDGMYQRIVIHTNNHAGKILGMEVSKNYSISYEDFQDILWAITFSDIV